MSNAFAPIVRARPNPIFGRPVHQGAPPIDYSPILLLKPFGFRIAPDTLSSDENLVGQRGITPAFGYSAPHPSAGGTLTLLIHALPSAHYDLLDLLFLLLKCRGFSPNHIVDVGANHGYWTRTALKYFPDAYYTLIEP
jgi:hypothetical protein